MRRPLDLCIWFSLLINPALAIFFLHPHALARYVVCTTFLSPGLTSGELVYPALPWTRNCSTRCQLKPNCVRWGCPSFRISLMGLCRKAVQVEVLTLLRTSPELVCAQQPQRVSVVLHRQLIRPLCTPSQGLDTTCDTLASQIPTQLRVIKLTTVLLLKLGTGAGSWRIVRSKGGRGWYVDTASGSAD